MRSGAIGLPLVLLLCLLAGCKKSEPSRTEDLQPRLGAAMQINSVKDRDDALKAVAVDAASLGAGDIVKQAVGAINNVSLHDETASDCALRLAKARQGNAAKDVAQEINSVQLRDRTFKKMAEGS